MAQEPERKLQEEVFDGQKYYYQRIWFSPEAVDQLYLGDAFIGYTPEENKEVPEDPRDSPALQRVLEAGRDGFMPKVVASLDTLFEAENFHYDGWEVGPGDAALYYWLRADRYHELIDRLKGWVLEQDLDGMVEW